ncbi:MAG: F0F1 ATP synthase subunit B [Geothermobacteraceae bacterium]
MISIDLTLVIQFINFIILMVLLNLILFRPLRRILQERRETIEGGKARAEELETAIEEKLARYEEQLQEARVKGGQERAALRQAAQEEEARILAAAHEEASGNLKKIKDQVANEAEAARQALRAESEAIASQIASRVLGRSLS